MRFQVCRYTVQYVNMAEYHVFSSTSCREGSESVRPQLPVKIQIQITRIAEQIYYTGLRNLKNANTIKKARKIVRKKSSKIPCGISAKQAASNKNYS
jgi:hypothetical protein